VNQIKEAAAVLLLPVSEADIVESIIEGLHPAQWSRFVFQSLPRSFSDLDCMCVVDQNLFSVASMSRAPTHVQVEQIAGVPVVATLPSRRHDFTHAERRRDSRSMQCYYFSRVGHRKLECRLWLSCSVASNPRPQSTGD
jgi:hypothetical protein